MVGAVFGLRSLEGISSLALRKHNIMVQRGSCHRDYGVCLSRHRVYIIQLAHAWNQHRL